MVGAGRHEERDEVGKDTTAHKCCCISPPPHRIDVQPQPRKLAQVSSTALCAVVGDEDQPLALQHNVARDRQGGAQTGVEGISTAAYTATAQTDRLTEGNGELLA